MIDHPPRISLLAAGIVMWGGMTAAAVPFPGAGASSRARWQSIGPGGGGWWTTLEAAPENPDIVYAGCDVGGIYRTRDGGESWTIINEGLHQYAVDDLLIDSANPSIVYAATLGGVYKSTDGGDHWSAKRNGFPPPREDTLTAPVACLALKPGEPGVLYAGSGVGRYYRPGLKGTGTIYTSLDGGETWAILNSRLDIDPEAMIFSIEINPLAPGVIWAATNLGLYESLDGGYRWSLRSNGLPHPHARQIRIDPRTGDTIYVTLWLDDVSGQGKSGVYKSSDGGDSWSGVNTGLPQGDMDIYWKLVVEPGDPDVLYVANQYGEWKQTGVFKTSDAGGHWSLVTVPGANVEEGWIDFWDVNVQCLAVCPSDPRIVYFGTPGFLMRSDDAGGSWRQIYSRETAPGVWAGRGPENTYAQAVAVDPADPDRILAGYADTGLLLSEDGGKSYRKIWTGAEKEGSDVLSIHFDPDWPRTVYLTMGETVIHGRYGNVLRSDDRGYTWKVASTKIPDAGLPYGRYTALLIDRSSPLVERTLYTACVRDVDEAPSGGIFKSTDWGRSWFEANNGIPPDTEHVATLAIDPFDSRRVYAGVPVWWGHGTGGFFLSEDAGASWRKTAANLGSVWKIVADPQHPGVVYAATSSLYGDSRIGGIFKSTDGGLVFTRLVTGLPHDRVLWVRDLAIDPFHPEVLLACTGGLNGDIPHTYGILATRNGGQTWFDAGAGLTTTILESILIDPVVNGRAFAGTGGNGLFVCRDLAGLLRSDRTSRPLPVSR